MHGDRSGSPRRDDRLFSGPHGPSPRPSGPPADDPASHSDVKVAGAKQSALLQEPPSFDPGSWPGEQGTEAWPPAGARPGPDSIGHDDPAAPGRAGRSGHSGRSARSREGGAPVKVAAVACGVALVIGGGAATAVALTGGDDGEPAPAANRPAADAPRVDLRAMAAQRQQENLRKAQQDAHKEKGGSLKLQPKGSPPPASPSPGESGGGGGGGGAIPPSDPVPSGVAQQYAKSVLPSYFGSSGSGTGQFSCLVNLWNRESGWRTNAGNPSSGAYGIPQALPGSKMASEGADWMTNHKTQIKWGLKYIKSRYSTPCGAWSHFQSNNWY